MVYQGPTYWMPPAFCSTRTDVGVVVEPVVEPVDPEVVPLVVPLVEPDVVPVVVPDVVPEVVPLEVVPLVVPLEVVPLEVVLLEVASNASNQIHDPPDEPLCVPVASIASVWLPLARPVREY